MMGEKGGVCVPSDLLQHVYSFLVQGNYMKAAKALQKATEEPLAALCEGEVGLLDFYTFYQSRHAGKRTAVAMESGGEEAPPAKRKKSEDGSQPTGVTGLGEGGAKKKKRKRKSRQSGTGVGGGAEVTGVSADVTGVSAEVTGVSAGVTGVSTEVAGVSTEVAGVSTEVSGSNAEVSKDQNTSVGEGVVGGAKKKKRKRKSRQSGTGVGGGAEVTGASADVTGVNAEITGVSAEVAGVGAEVAGVSMEVTQKASTGERGVADTEDEGDTSIHQPVLESTPAGATGGTLLPEEECGGEATPITPIAAGPGNSGKKNKKRQSGGIVPFKRVTEEMEVDPRLQDNSFEAKARSQGSWGEKANRDLKFTKGRSFRHEKTKKKRGTYKGGAIDTSVCSIKFDSD